MRKEFHWVSNKLYVHNFLGFSTRLQPYTIYLGYLYLPPLMRPGEGCFGMCPLDVKQSQNQKQVICDVARET